MKLHLPPYQPRYIRFEDVWSRRPLTLKAYLITERLETSVPPPLIESAKRYIAEFMPGACQREGSDHGLGYVVIHVGDMATWLLTRWWAHDNVGMSMLAAAEPETLNFSSTDHRHFCACVWEHVVINHERNAWVKDVMRVDGNSHAYLENRLPDGYF